MQIKTNIDAIFSCITCCVQSHSCVRLFSTPWTAAHLTTLSFTISWSLLKLMSIESVMPSNHLILCLPFSSCPQSFPALGSFQMSQLFASSGQRIGVSASTSEEVAGRAPRILRSFPCPVPELPNQARARRHRAALCPGVVIASQFLSQLPPHPTSRPLDSACRFPGPYLAALWRGFVRIWEKGLRKEERIGKKKKKE